MRRSYSEKKLRPKTLQKTQSLRQLDKSSPQYISAETKNMYVLDKNDYDSVLPGQMIRYIRDGELKKAVFVWYKNTHKITKRQFWMVGFQRNCDMSKSKFALYWDAIGQLFMPIDNLSMKLIKSLDNKRDLISDMHEFLQKNDGREFAQFMRLRQAGRNK